MHPLSELTWRRLPDMPRAMRYPQSVTMDAAVYIADREYGSGVIHRYDLQTKEWTELTEYHYCYFTMTEHNHQLTVVGGWDVSTGKITNTVAVYSSSEKSWKQPYPPMNTPRYDPAVYIYQQYLVVAGGNDTDLGTVEILDVSTLHSQWLSATPLPMSCYRMSAASIHSTLYLLGGTLQNQVFSVSLPALTQTDKPPAQWCTLSNTPLEYSTAIAVHGTLLALGGSLDQQRSSAIYIYDQERNTWNKGGDLPTERTYCTCCLLPSGEILVAGGEDKNGRDTSRIDVAAVED